MLHKRSRIAIMGWVAALVMMPVGAALAQGTDPVVPPNFVSLSNAYIDFRLGVSGTVTDGENTYQVSGRWGVSTRAGDPETDGDDNKNLLTSSGLPYGTPDINFAIWKIKVGNADPVMVGGPSGMWTKTPRVYSPPTPGLGLGKTGPYIEGEWTSDADGGNGIPSVKFKFRISLVRDQVRFEFNVVNTGNATQSIGVAMFGDSSVGYDNTAGFPFVAGIGLARLSGFPDQIFGTVLSGTKVPNYFEVFDSVDNPVVTARNTLRGQDCVVPDYVAIGDYAFLSPTDVWLPEGYQPELENPRTPVENVTWMLVWRQSAVRPSATRNIVTYFGVGASCFASTHRLGSRVNQDSAMLAVQGPRALKYDSTGGTLSQLSPYTFKIKAYVYNLDTDPGPYNLDDVSAYLYLPKGLELVPGSEAQQELGSVPINSEGTPVEWEVAATGEYCGELEYYVSVKDVSGWQQVVSRKIMIPAIKRTTMRGGGYHLISVPFTANNPSIQHLLGWTSGSYFAKGWDPTGVGSYYTVASIEPGKAFWASLVGTSASTSVPVTLANDAMIAGEVGAEQVGEVHVELGQGWNMVGNPFVYPVYLGQLMVYNRTTNTTVTFDQAVAQNWINRTVFGWNPDKQAYEYLKGNDSYLLPWKGYWMRTRVPVTLVFRPAIWPAGGVRTLVGGY